MNAFLRTSSNGLGLLLAVVTFSCSQLTFSEQPEKVDLCQLVSDRGKYNHKLIEVEGFVSHGFEDFTLVEPGCSSLLDIWLEYGGTSRSGTMYCCGVGTERTRPEPLKIEDITVNLVEDGLFREFDRLVHREPDSVVHATLIGRFFSGERQEIRSGLLPGGVRWAGFGHMGCCSLLAIQQVVSIDRQDRTDLDYRASPASPDLEKLKCGSYRDLVPIDPSRRNFEAQRKAEAKEQWAFNDPQRVAAKALVQLAKISESSLAGKLRKKHEEQGRMIYEWHPRPKGPFYMVVISRPYWLSFYANDPNKIAWVVIAAYLVCG